MRDGGGVVALNAHQAMALGLGVAAAEAAGEAAAIGGYRPSPADLARIRRALSEGVQAMVVLVADWAAVTDEQLAGAARDLGVQVVHEILGPPAPEALN